MIEQEIQSPVEETTPHQPTSRAAHLLPFSWKPGHSGNPAGRPKGARSKLAEKAVDDILATWEEGGIEALRKLRDTDPGKYVSAVVSLIPKQIEADHHLQIKVTSSVDALVLKLASLAERDAEYESHREAAITIDAEAVPVKQLEDGGK